MRMELGRHLALLFQELAQLRFFHAGFDFGRLALAAADIKSPKAGDIAARHVRIALRHGELFFERSRCKSLTCSASSRVMPPSFEHAVEITFVHRLPLFDRPIKLRLRECRFVAFVVPPAAVAIHVDYDIALEFAAEIHPQANHLRHGFRIFAVDVEDGDLQHLGHVGGVGRERPSEGWW